MEDIRRLRRSVQEGTIRDIMFEDLWHLFEPGQLVYTGRGNSVGARRAYRVLYVTRGRSMLNSKGRAGHDDDQLKDRIFEYSSEEAGQTMPRVLGTSNSMTPLLIDCCYTDYDGEYYGPKSVRFVFLEYTGRKDISALDIFPAHFDENAEATRAELLARGRKFVGCAGVSHKRYSGRSLLDNGRNLLDAHFDHVEEVRCECVFDQRYKVDNQMFKFGDELIAYPSEWDRREWADAVAYNRMVHETDLWADADMDLDRRKEFMRSELGTKLLDTTSAPSDDHIILLPIRLCGYALADRRWYALDVNHIEDVPWDSKAIDAPMRSFNDLVLPESPKVLIEALVKNQMREVPSPAAPDGGFNTKVGPSTLDVIRGKGRGLIVLLHGVPGVGKTSTAESVAAQLGRPLFPITCGDLGTDAATVEERLRDYSQLAQKWKCVLLLDEADVFLARRSQGDFKRNGLVSVFLRVLEYYAGVLILTTHRVGEFDEAFRSRIHVSLYYPRLDKKSTSQIFEVNIRRIRDSPDINIHVEEDGIRAFAEQRWSENEENPGRRWNGRQIKNAFQTANALANWDFLDRQSHKGPKPVLTAKHFKYVADTSTDFDKYLDEVHLSSGDGAYSEMAAEDRLRRDTPTTFSRSGSHAPQTPLKGPRASLGGPSRDKGKAATDPVADEKQARIKTLKRQLELLDRSRMSEEKREEKRFEYQVELAELCGDEDVFGEGPAVGGAPDESEKNAPWA